MNRVQRRGAVRDPPYTVRRQKLADAGGDRAIGSAFLDVLSNDGDTTRAGSGGRQLATSACAVPRRRKRSPECLKDGARTSREPRRAVFFTPHIVDLHAVPDDGESRSTAACVTPAVGARSGATAATAPPKICDGVCDENRCDWRKSAPDRTVSGSAAAPSSRRRCPGAPSLPRVNAN
jgi:hypothetical protein